MFDDRNSVDLRVSFNFCMSGSACDLCCCVLSRSAVVLDCFSGHIGSTSFLNTPAQAIRV